MLQLQVSYEMSILIRDDLIKFDWKHYWQVKFSTLGNNLISFFRSILELAMKFQFTQSIYIYSMHITLIIAKNHMGIFRVCSRIRLN